LKGGKKKKKKKGRRKGRRKDVRGVKGLPRRGADGQSSLHIFRTGRGEKGGGKESGGGRIG